MANKTRCAYSLFPFPHRFARLKTLIIAQVRKRCTS